MALAGHRRRWLAGLLLGSAWLAGCSSTAPLPTTGAPDHPTAVSACADALGDGWQVAVEVDHDDGSILGLVKGDSIATCQTWLDAARRSYGPTTTGIGLHPSPSPAALSYLTSGGTGAEPDYLLGRIPADASAVRVTVADGTAHDAVIGNGLWLVWLDEPGQPTLIEALGASGQATSTLTDPDGIEPAG